MHHRKAQGQDLLRLKEVAQVRTREIPARRAVALLVDRPLVELVLFVFEVDRAAPREELAVARNARHGKLFTWSGSINLKNEKYKLDEKPIDEQCDCPVCRNFSRAYLRHLFKAEEILALRLAVMHNLYFYNKLTQRIRDALDAGEFAAFRAEYSAKLSERV